jgi:plasmid maintenance system antidote protein VapI
MESSFYTIQSYRRLIASAISERKLFESAFTAQRLAEEIGIQKSYLSKVLSNKAHLSSDQIFLVGKFFQWTEDQTDFALKLLELERTGVQARKNQLQQQISEIQQKHLQIAKAIELPALEADLEALQEYYLSPWVQLIHVCLSIPRYAKDLALLAQDLQLPEKVVSSAVKILLKLKIVRERRDRGFEVLLQEIHLSKTSPVFHAWQTQIRLSALHRLRAAPHPSDYNFNVLFSADESTRVRLQDEILSLLKSAENHVKDSAERDAYYMSVDLFRWTGR